MNNKPLPIRGVRIFKEQAGVISKGPCWVAFVGPYMHTGDTLILLLKDIITCWRSDAALVG